MIRSSAQQLPAKEEASSAAAPASPMRAERAEREFRSAKRHSGRVRVLKRILPAAVVLMIGALVARSFFSLPDGVSVDMTGTAIENGRLVMSSPKLDGFTSDNRAYTMTATRAIQDLGDAGRIDLEEIDARLPFEAANWMTVAARTGAYDRDANTLDLGEDITVTTDTGIRAKLKSAKVDMGAGHIDSTDPVDITLEGARIEADSMSIRDNGAVMIFDKRVRMQIEGGRMQTAAGRDEGETDEN